MSDAVIPDDLPTCRYCRRVLFDDQEIDWRMCEGCYYEGQAEQEAQR